MSNSDLTIRVEGRVGYITLTRPKVLNAVNEAIVDGMTEAMTRWADDPAISLVMVDSDSERAFSAGGDLSAMYEHGRAGQFDAGNAFWRDEYRLNAMIAHYPKPYVAFMDGIVMGGGVGLSAHGSHRIVTEHSVVAMPECSIGLITDVGGTYLLHQAPGHLGEYLGLTGTRMNGADAIYAKLADHYVEREKLAALKARLIETGDATVISEFSSTPPTSVFAERQSEIDHAFSGETVHDITDRLSTLSSEWAVKALEAIRRGSPISLQATLKAIREADTLEIGIRNEYRFVSRVLEHGDFIEGIRAVIVDKDRNPRWKYAGLDDVPRELLALMMQEAEGGDLLLPAR
ncbi:enoyl-CoA hydratase/isomerase family protein [Rhizobium rhizoryzae]|uniref:3-hydroxyisobutyryl-CoA hydrolase n=1 Tax=Rhizobium rhizoryzae TaxID=451876 RepID=A0A7W6PQM2_9HYPH|nr:enoyl-CoA hydratase/isomerase family protein [Rhizobium rhizoryzae]MBB4144325.1 enoyl-CoA hydratase [Rhizobium rhizoryzae]